MMMAHAITRSALTRRDMVLSLHQQCRHVREKTMLNWTFRRFGGGAHAVAARAEILRSGPKYCGALPCSQPRRSRPPAAFQRGT